MSKEELANQIEMFILNTARENGLNSGTLCVKNTLEAVQEAFEGCASIYTCCDKELTIGFNFWKDVARKVENLKDNI